jgi:signal transduction histidine kinase
VPEHAFRRLLDARWLDAAIAAAPAATMLVALVADDGATDSPWAPLLVVLGAAPVAFFRTHPVAATAAGAAALLVVPNVLGEFLPAPAGVIPFALSYGCGAHAPTRRGLAAVVLLICAMQIGMGFSEFPNVEIAFVTLPAWWVGREIRSRTAIVRMLEERTRELADEQDAFVSISVRRERARIAGELHDVVAHHLAVIAIQASAGRMARAIPADRTREHFVAIREAGGQALAEMSRLVDILHADSGRVGVHPNRLEGLLDQALAGGLRLHVDPLPTLAAALEDGAVRVLQEGLTNVMKHAPRADVHVSLSAVADALDIEVRNTRGVAAPMLAASGSGMGLAGMRERVEALGGTFEAGPQPDGGWLLHARLPALTPTG